MEAAMDNFEGDIVASLADALGHSCYGLLRRRQREEEEGDEVASFLCLLDELYVRDCNTRNGTFINQTYARMDTNKIMKIPFGTIMYLGGKGCWIRVLRR